MPSAIESFIADLPLAFPMAYPPDMRFSECQCGECGELRKDFEGLDWMSVPHEIIERHNSHIVLLGSEALRYFFPAFLRSSLLNPESAFEVDVISMLNPSGFKADDLSKFTDDQRGMIVRFLDLVLCDNDEPPSKRWLKMRARWAPGQQHSHT